jgi:AcrR family transcriptional regulator
MRGARDLAGARPASPGMGTRATVRRLEEETGLSRGAIFHHFRDKESLFSPSRRTDAAAMVDTVSRNGLVQVMRDLLQPPAARGGGAGSARGSRCPAGCARIQPFAQRGPGDAIAARDPRRLNRQREAGVLRDDVDVAVLAQFLELAYDGPVPHSPWAVRSPISAVLRPRRGCRARGRLADPA